MNLEFFSSNIALGRERNRLACRCGAAKCQMGSVTMSIDRRKFLKSSLLATTGALASPYIISPARAAGTINVGVLFSLTVAFRSSKNRCTTPR